MARPVNGHGVGSGRASAATPLPPLAVRVRPRFITLARAALAEHWPVAVVLALFGATALIVPTLAPIATTDDWGYARSVEILYHEGRLEIFPVVAATAVFQIAWGALFAVLFEPTLGVFRLSTVVMVAIGGWALSGLCRELGMGRGRAALGVAAYLFNPLAYVLAFTFMTDPHFTALLLISTYFYARGLGAERGTGTTVLVGSAVAACAFLTRQQGALIPLAVVTYLLLGKRLAPDRRGLALLLRVGVLPTAAVIGYFAWLHLVNDVPAVQGSFLREATQAGWGGVWRLLKRLTYVEQLYLGFFALPLVVAAIPAARRATGSLPRAGRVAFLAWEAVLIASAVATWRAGGRMPHIGQFFGSSGLGAPDVLGSRPRLLGETLRDGLTIVCAAASLALALLLCRRLGTVSTGRGVELPRRGPAGLVLAVALWQVVGVLPPSFHYLNRGGSLDRYLLPLLPLAICLTLWAVRDLPLAPRAGWLVIAAFALFSVAGTRDYLVYMQGVWSLAREANAAGVDNQRLDAGSGWDGYHLYEYSRDNKIRARTAGGPWWVYFYAPATDSSYVVAGVPLPDFLVVSVRDYSSWLDRRPTSLYLLRRPTAPWPPTAEAVEIPRLDLPDPRRSP